VLAGDENDLLSESPVFNKGGPANSGRAIDEGSFPKQHLPIR
jgi:hypothetical protein